MFIEVLRWSIIAFAAFFTFGTITGMWWIATVFDEEYAKVHKVLGIATKILYTVAAPFFMTVITTVFLKVLT